MGLLGFVEKVVWDTAMNPMNALYEKAPPKGVPFTGCRYMRGYVRISLVEVYERKEKSVISVDERPKRFTDVFYRCEKDWETFWFCDLFRQ